MTIASTRTDELTVERAVIVAMRLAGLKGPMEVPSAQELLHGQDLLALLIKGPLFSQAVTRGLVFRSITTTGLTLTYSLQQGDIDLFGDPAFTPTGETNPRPVRQIDGARWQTLGATSITDEPAFVWADRSANPVVLNLWPGAAAGTLRVRVHRPRADISDATTTLDVEQHWQQPLVQALAAELAMAATLPASRVDGLTQRAGGAAVMARGMSGEKVQQFVEMRHRTGWRI